MSEPELNLTVLESYPLTQQSAMLEVAFQYSRLIRYPERNAAERSLQLLHARNKITASAALRDVPQPAQRDDEGHLSGRFQIDSGQVDEQLFLGFSWRPAYHDLTDQTLGYPQGSELRFFDTTVRVYEEDGFKIEDFTLVGIQSLKARNRFFKPLSWRVALSGRRVYEGESRPWVPSAEGLLGPSWQMGSGLFYALVGGEARLSKKLANGYDALAKTDFGFIDHSASQQLAVGISIAKSLENPADNEYHFFARQVFKITPRWNVYWDFGRRNDQDRYRSAFDIGVNVYQ
ncbi:MAG: hypothetical protein P8077_09535 [Gammaproteobacteria bacterium]